MKKYFLIITILTLCHTLWAGPVDETTARKVAQNIYLMNMPTKTVCEMERVALPTDLSNLYIFNVKDGEGFVIVSGDDCASPVLAYSTESSWVPELLPPAVNDWLKGYSHAIQWAQEHQLDSKAFQQEWAYAMAGISRMDSMDYRNAVTTSYYSGKDNSLLLTYNHIDVHSNNGYSVDVAYYGPDGKQAHFGAWEDTSLELLKKLDSGEYLTNDDIDGLTSAGWIKYQLSKNLLILEHLYPNSGPKISRLSQLDIKVNVPFPYSVTVSSCRFQTASRIPPVRVSPLRSGL